VHALTKLLLNVNQLPPHSLADRVALHREVPVPVLPADVRESQKIERFGLPFSSLFPVLFGKSPELNPARFVWVQFQSKLSQPFPQFHQESICVSQILKTENIIVGVPDDNDIASRAFPAPDIHPQVEHVMQIDVREQRRNHRTLRSTHLRALPFAFLHHSGLQPFLDQPENTAVGNAVLDKLQEPFV
jgi:hypothetical protein